MFLVPDESHAIKNSFLELLKGIKAYDVLLLLLVTFNCEMGRRTNEERRQAMRDRLATVYNARRAQNTSLFLTKLQTW